MKRGFLIALLFSSAAMAQRGAEWVTNGADAQRSHWIPTDPKISPGNMQKGFEFLWKRQFAMQLAPAILMDRYIGYRGFRSFAFASGSSNTVWAIDSDLNRVEWEAKLTSATSPSSAVCPGVTSPIARATTNTEYPVPSTFGGLGGRARPAASDVGQSGEGAVTIPAALRSVAAAARNNAPRPAYRPPPPAVIYSLSSDGTLHTMYISNGIEPDPPIPFLPSDANAEGLAVIDGVAYASTHNCGAGKAGVWALDLSSKQISSWKPSSGDIAGTAGPVFGPDGTIYAATTSGELVALNSKTLTVKASYSSGAAWTSSPVVFPYKQKNLVAAAGKDGSIHVVDVSSMRSFAKSASTENFHPGALVAWQSDGGTRWLVASSENSVKAWRIADAAIEPGWTSREIASPLTPMVIHGVVFAVQKSPAILYALDGSTGKALWDSGKTITSSVASGGLSGGASQIYLGTQDGTFYAFGYAIEH